MPTTLDHFRWSGVCRLLATTGVQVAGPHCDLSHQVLKIATYASWAARDLRAKGRKARVWDLFARPAWRFMRDYVFMNGWRDGAAGFVVAWVSAFSVFLKYACLLLDTPAA